MWRCLLVILALSLGLQAYQEIIRPSKEDLQSMQVGNIEYVVRNRCLKNANEDAFRELKKAAPNFSTCMSESLLLPNISKEKPEDVFHIVCSKSREDIYRYYENILEKAEPCLNLQEKYFSEMLLSAFNATFERQCSEGVESVAETFLALQSANCTLPVKYWLADLSGKCAEKLDHINALLISAYALKKADFCHDVELAHICAIDGTKSRCNNNENLIDFIEKIFEHVLNFCRKDGIADSEVTRVIFE